METIVYNAQGVCARQIIIELDNEIIKNVEFVGGCHGNHQGINALVKGLKISEVIEKLKGITCGGRPTSCPDQLAVGLAKFLDEKTKTHILS